MKITYNHRQIYVTTIEKGIDIFGNPYKAVVSKTGRVFVRCTNPDFKETDWITFKNIKTFNEKKHNFI